MPEPKVFHKGQHRVPVTAAPGLSTETVNLLGHTKRQHATATSLKAADLRKIKQSW